ncbi:FecCD family ABC transporter permease [Actinomyces naeslundii]|uniref:Iron chelate uptake ABC transporter, FeCT family, permease protein n=2 Tax=Actinomyces naeslundii TaxID=1655 RepID=J3F4C4_ACTNH|nr:iron chelate uptake ABC transporter family permease subunit [Actinomyces naeslundii]EJN85612.1 iron chelate uptake ABC transporter, FeCT family, permease protein [Actinomyces naeslundii str. Howell 279]OMG20286.1 iron ABC transporter permease [Actinomyces naeslundii]OMG27637.1 iron ABC transporter permease [Actinomyces naeslundii]OMG35012.1 iron ABC transporter permease [Actinomyces naeslundii]QQC20882.1 iron chelate uptake ABC transporter family permease subunit [Actinomyces naeslundii]
MRGIRLNRAAAAVRPPAAAGPRRRLHVGTDGGRLWIVVGRWSVLISPRHVLIGLMLLALGLAVAVAALRLGKLTVSTQEVIDALQGRGRRIVQVVVVTWKLPRILLGLVAGLALGVAGAVFQTITRNPLGSPDLIGFSTGAQTGILVSVLLLPGSMLSTSLASFIGGAAVGVVTYLVSLRGGFTGLRFILVGIAISSMLVSVNRWLLVRVDDDEGLGALKAITGSLGAARWPVVTPICLAIGVTVTLTLLASRHLRVLSLGEQVATILGSPTRRASALLVLLGTVLVAVVTMAAGPIGFVALVAPHLARLLTGSPQPPLLVSGLTGSLLLAGADLLSQLLLESMPASVVTNAVGGLYLMVALTVAARGRRSL